MTTGKEIERVFKFGGNCFQTSENAVKAENKLEVLTALSQSLLKEIETLKQSFLDFEDDKIDFAEEVHRFEENLIRNALLKTGGRQRKAAKLLNLKPSTLNSKIKRFGIL